MRYFVIPLAFGLITGFVGRRKGSSFLLWTVIGFCIPIIGLVAAILSRDERHDPERECPSCGRLLPISAQVCSRCGADLEYPAELIVPTAAIASLNGGAAD